MDKFTEKLVQNALSTYIPKLKEMSASRADELASMKAKVRANPDEVEAWFDKEIDRTRNQLNDALKKIMS
ncbi:hypothetical protein NTE_00364 [Candidatus Nitrososphaera evergladensis SR1]|uniref:Uncharacterized protein n=1 Tax=Candidatus Nitrososphaera evergladensis SR1 TaxID=1459636 RepID=A0A075MLS1_9ARCH|nr:hypothetical protein [Candidatus Nitrososphaera evergladensis]AIF82446.1 hypothetical protein NTE_00364 [Candidatus Nitrososphaera evergladensis SR1]